jgi:hypothetical protein
MPKATNPDYNPFASAIFIFVVLLVIPVLFPGYWPIVYYSTSDENRVRHSNTYWKWASGTAGVLAFLSMFIYTP